MFRNSSKIMIGVLACVLAGPYRELMAGSINITISEFDTSMQATTIAPTNILIPDNSSFQRPFSLSAPNNEGSIIGTVVSNFVPNHKASLTITDLLFSRDGLSTHFGVAFDLVVASNYNYTKGSPASLSASFDGSLFFTSARQSGGFTFIGSEGISDAIVAIQGTVGQPMAREYAFSESDSFDYTQTGEIGLGAEMAGAFFETESVVGIGPGMSASSASASVTITPEPSSLMLLGVGTIGILGYCWQRRATVAHRATFIVQ
jgi:hypothetical protein